MLADYASALLLEPQERHNLSAPLLHRSRSRYGMFGHSAGWG